MWKKHLINAAEKDASLKQKLASALIKACHDTGWFVTVTLECVVYIHVYIVCTM